MEGKSKVSKEMLCILKYKIQLPPRFYLLLLTYRGNVKHSKTGIHSPLGRSELQHSKNTLKSRAQ